MKKNNAREEFGQLQLNQEVSNYTNKNTIKFREKHTHILQLGEYG